MWNVHVGDLPEVYPVLVAVAYQLYVTPVFVPTLYEHEADPVDADTGWHDWVTPLTVNVTEAPETALPLLVTLTFSVTVEPVFTLAPFAGLTGVTDSFAEVVVTMIWFTCCPTGVAVTRKPRVVRTISSNCSNS